ncbi:HIR complex subunit [Rhodotorula kratochvilovae]
MHVVKPAWVAHPDETRPSKPALTIFTLDVHPDNSRLATGGLDSLVRIWSTVPILHPQAENDDRCPKLLSTLSAHTGVVMSVRWNNAGSFLASGSDDRVVMIWAHEGGGGGKVWGTETTNVENWKAVRRLVGHNSDVAGVAWSPDDAYCASVGLDNVVLIWSGQTFELVRKLDGHQGFVKGLVFDPVGQYLATQADDNSLKVWRTTDWQLQADIREPFEDAPKATVIRPTWSPDGAYIVTPNSMNGPVFCAAVIDRTSWKSPASLIGHQDIVQAAAYCPLVFLRDATQPPSVANICSLLALCAQGTISLWFTDISQPFAVVADLFDRDVLDLSWSRDGTQLWASSSDGQVAVLQFELGEFAPVAPKETAAALHALYGYVPRARPALSAASSLQLGRPATPNLGEGTLTQPKQLVARKGPGAKRPRVVQPVVAQPVPAPAAAAAPGNPFASAPTFPGQAPPLALNAFASTSAQPYAPAPAAAPQQFVQPPAFGAPAPAPAPQVVNDLSGARKRKASHAPAAEHYPQPYPYPYPYPPPHAHAEGPAPAAPPPQVPGYGSAPRVSAAEYRLRGHTLGPAPGTPRGDAVPEGELRELVPAYALYDREVTFRVSNRAGTDEGRRRALAVPAVVSYGRLGVEDEAKDVFEWRNFADGARKGESEVTVTTAKKALWIDYLPKYIVAAAGSPVFTAVCLEDGSLVAWSPAGRRLIPTLVLDAPCAFLVAEGPYLLALTALGTLAVWNLSPSIPKPRSIYPPLNISALLASSATRRDPFPSITTSALLPNGTPLVALSTGATFSYDADLASWTRVCEPWWARSDAWEGRRGRHAAASHGGRGIVKNIEGAVNEIVVDEQARRERDGGAADESSDEESDAEGAAAAKEVGDVEMNGAAEKGKGKASAAADDEGGDELATPVPAAGKKRPTPQGAPASPSGDSDDFRVAVALAHLETRLAAAAALDSPSEYRLFLVQYAKKLADEGLRSKAEELIRELLGPIYHKPGKKEEDEWSATVLGLAKRDLLRDVLRELAKQRVTAPLAAEYQEILKKISAA